MIESVILTFIIGASVGSFLNVCIYRIPRGLSVIAPRSFCPACRTTLGWLELVPLFSFVFCQGRCRHCSSRIPWLYPAVELVAGTSTVAILMLHGLSVAALTIAAFLSLMLAVAVIDWRHFLVPNCIVVTGLGIILLLKAIFAPLTIAHSMFSLAISFAGMAAIAALGRLIFHKDVMGMGDIKLSALIGFSLGAWPFLFCVWGASLLAVSFSALRSGLSACSRRSIRRDERLPFASFLAVTASSWILFAPACLADELIPLALHDWPS